MIVNGRHPPYRSSGPSVEPLLVSDIKAQSRIDTSDEDSLISAYITAARELCELRTGRTFITTTLVQNFDYDEWPSGGVDVIELPRPKLISVTSIKYLDSSSGTQTTWAASNYTTDTTSIYGRVYPVYGGVWITPRDIQKTVEITWTAGYGAAASNVPGPILQALRMIVAHWYENRGDAEARALSSDIGRTVDALLLAETVKRVAA